MKLVESVYNPPHKKNILQLRQVYEGPFQTAYYSLARHALKSGLKALGLSTGDSVLLPELICRDVLAPFRELGIEILFYKVSDALQISSDLEILPRAKAIMAVHYFGLEFDLTPFLKYCQKHTAFLIEDNAHGLFSRNSRGEFLGANGDIGIISVRKSLPISNGALLICKKELSLQAPLAIVDQKRVGLTIKNKLRPFVALLGIRSLLLVTRLKRHVRKLVTGDAFPISNDEDERVVPFPPNPINIDRYFQKVDIQGEIERRRELFLFLADYMKEMPITPLRKSLSDKEVPYVYPFYCTAANISLVRAKLEAIGLEIVNWPALPKMILEKDVPDFFQNLYLVKFLW